MNDHQKIQARIDGSPVLEKFSDLLHYAWEEKGHAEWVSNAPIEEIVDWAQVIRNNEYAE